MAIHVERRTRNTPGATLAKYERTVNLLMAIASVCA
jgi:hypothetical protein